MIALFFNYWSTPCFRIQHIFERFQYDLSSMMCLTLSLPLSFSQRFVPGQGLVLYPQIGDKMDIVCPRMEGGSTEGVEYYKLYMVPLEQLKSCQVTKADTPLTQLRQTGPGCQIHPQIPGVQPKPLGPGVLQGERLLHYLWVWQRISVNHPCRTVLVNYICLGLFMWF